MRSNEKQKRNLVIEIKDRREGDGVGDIIYGMEWMEAGIKLADANWLLEMGMGLSELSLIG